jgi:phosphohistidine phosphatase
MKAGGGMELILWRHAEAEPGEPDLERALTAGGRRQAAKMAAWLDRKLPSSCRILCSPALRCRQTAEALQRKFRIHADLAPDAGPEQLLAAAGWPDGREPVLLIGHQPALGRTAALLIGSQAQNWTVRKGSIVWIARRERDGGGNYLRAVLVPELAK